MDKPWLFLIVPFCSIFILVGGGLMAHAGRGIVKGIEARQWPQTTGQLLSVGSKDTSDAESQSREICVHYTYRVAGTTYDGTRIHPCYGSSSFEETHRGLETLLKKAKEIRVYYDAAQPSESVLSVGFYSSSLAAFFGGLIFFAMGLGFLLTFWFAIAGNFDIARGITVIR